MPPVFVPRMNTIKIIADTAQEALEQVQTQVGPDAVILNVRPVHADGVKRLWSKARVEVLATAPEPPSAQENVLQLLTAKVHQLEGALQGADSSEPLPPNIIQMMQNVGAPQAASEVPACVQVLLEMGLLPQHAEMLAGQLQKHLGGTRPRNLIEEMELAREVLVDQWQRFATRAEQPGLPARVMVGAPGAGKTTALCKWVTQETFLRQRPARLWRLDGAQPNTAEFLSLHGEMMQVPVERVWADSLDVPEDTLRFVDLPGVPATPTAVEELAAHLKPLGPADVQLVLNSAYELDLLLEQARVFSALPLTGLIFTHTDESDDLSKLWNVALAAELPVTFRSGGQTMPGGFQSVLPETLFDQWVSAVMQG